MNSPAYPSVIPGWFKDLFVADWRPMVFVHFVLPPEVLAPHVPYPLDLRDGRAFVSFVFFRLERMRPAGTGPIGRWLARPISDHPFLNVRTYVRGPAGPGIHFLAEWVSNRLSLRLGPRTYGLPYRFARFGYDTVGTHGVGTIRLIDPGLAASLRIAYPTRPLPLAEAAAGSMEEFLLERYAAYTCHRRVRRVFHVAHPPWRWHRADWLRYDAELVHRAFPWFDAAEFVGAHLSPGVFDVRMSRPHRLAPRRVGAEVLHCPAASA